MIDTKEIAQQKLDRALQLIEHAQGILRQAAEEVSPIVHACEQYDLILKEYDNVHNLWREVAYKTPRSKIDMDSDTKARIAEQNRKASLAGGFQANSPWTQYLLDIEHAKANGEIAPSYEEWTARKEASSVEKHEPTRLISEKEER